MRTCPPAEQFEALLAGRLDDEATAAVSAHLDRCRACRALVEGLTAEPETRKWATFRADSHIDSDGPPPAFLNRLHHELPRRSSRSGQTSLGRLASAADTSLPIVGHTAPPGYEVLGYLGRGGMGVVYKARHLALKRTVALKMLRPEAVGDAGQRARLVGEAETIARLQHPNIAQVFEVGDRDGVPYLALEFVEGPTLSQALDGKPLPPRVAAGLVATLARAAHHGHALGIVHRDLKPGNILLASPRPDVPPSLDACVPKISDFGLAKRLDETGQTHTGQVIGTPCYMAPEQARGASADLTPAADVYSLGAILYELLTGRPPLVGLTAVDTVVRVLNEEPARPRALVPGVPADLETACLKCLEKDPRRRYLSAAALADDLDRFLAGQSVLARPLGRPTRAARWARRHPSAATLFIALLVMAGIGFPTAIALWLGARAQEREAVAAGGRAREAQGEADRARADMTRQSAGLMADRGIKLAESGDCPQAIHWLVAALRACPDESPADRDLRAIIRVNIADLATRLPRPAAVLTGPAPPEALYMRAVAFSPDGRRGARRGDPGVGSGHRGPGRRPVPARPHPHDHTLWSLAFAPDGKTLLAGYGGPPGTLNADGVCYLWDVTTGQRRQAPARTGGVTVAVAWSHDGRRMAAGDFGAVSVWDAETGARTGGPWPTRFEVTGLRFTPDDRGLVITSGRRYMDQVWKSKGACELRDPADGRLLWSAAFPQPRPEGAALTPDGRVLMPAGEENGATVFRLDPATGARVGSPVSLPGGLGGLTPDGGPGRAPGARAVRPHRRRGHGPDPDGPADRLGRHRPGPGPDGHRVPAAVRPLVHAPPALPTGPPADRGDRPVRVRHSVPDRSAAASGEGAPAGGLQPGRVAAVRRLVATRAPVGRGQPDGRLVICLETRDAVRLRWADTGAPAGPPLTGPADVTAAAFGPDSRSLLVGYADGSARVWDLASMKPRGLPVAQRHRLIGVAWAPDGRTFHTISTAGAVRTWPAAGDLPTDDLAAITAAVELLTAARMDADRAVTPLERHEWLERYHASRADPGALDRVLGPVLSAADWHDARARDAEEEGDTTTALYHLDRRLEAAPDDGTAVLRRMHQRFLAGDGPGAASDLDRARRLVGPREVAVWCQTYEAISRDQGREAAAAWYARHLKSAKD
jgi:eukaryotic-like serine/threonine-protein kinase